MVTTDKGLCGSTNTNVLHYFAAQMKEWTDSNKKVQTTAIGNKGLGFPKIASVQMSSSPPILVMYPMDELIGQLKCKSMLIWRAKLMRFIWHTPSANTMKQEPVVMQLIPLLNPLWRSRRKTRVLVDYLYEPSPEAVVEELLVHFYIDSSISVCSWKHCL